MRKKLLAGLAIGVIMFAVLPYQFLWTSTLPNANLDSNAARSTKNGGSHFSVLDEENENETEEDEEDEGDLEVNESAGRVGSEDNSIEFEREVPGLSYEWNDGQREASFEMQEYTLVEFNDTNNNQHYDDEDEILYATGQQEDGEEDNEGETGGWNFSMKVRRDENNTIQNLTVTYLFNDTNHEIAFQMFVDRNSGADKIKISVIINKWNWKNENSLLALRGKLKAEIESENYQGTYNASVNKDSHGIYFSVGDSILLEYSWETSVQVDGEEASLKNAAWTTFENETETDEGEQEMEVELTSQLVYPRFNDRLFHDPVMGAEDNPNTVNRILPGDNNGGIVTYKLLLVGGIIGIISFLVVALFANHRKEAKRRKT